MNTASKSCMYRMDIVPAGGNRGGGQRGDQLFTQYCYTYHNLYFTKFNYPKDGCDAYMRDIFHQSYA